MKRWQEFEDHLLTGEWHVHTDYTDGADAIHSLLGRATELGIPLIAFTEHVRREMTYDYDTFAREVADAGAHFSTHVLIGCEAKILPDGSLDAPAAVLDSCDYVLAAVHSFAAGIDVYYEAVEKALTNPRVSGWAHPGLFPRKSGFHISAEWLDCVFATMRHASVLLEVNSRHASPPSAWLESAHAHGVLFVRGSDVHAASELTAARLDFRVDSDFRQGLER